MKNKFYYLLMFYLCCAGAALCFVFLLFGGSFSIIFKAAVLILGSAYIFGAVSYRRKLKAFIRRQKEYERLKKRKPHYYPENSYYPVIRRSA